MEIKIHEVHLPVLDKGFIEIVDVMGNDTTVVNAARVSFANKSFDPTKDEGLLRYLLKHKHVSPFYHPQLMFRIKAPISVQRQWFKHKIGTAENSESTRYIEVHEEFYIPEKFRKQSKSNKQGSAEDFPDFENKTLRGFREDFYNLAYQQYLREVEAGVAKELARGVLPLETYTSWVWTASLQAVLHFLQLRKEATTQYEIKQYANAMEQLVEPYFPIIFKIIKEQ